MRLCYKLSAMKEKKAKEELQTRRDFFRNAAKAALPILGAVVVDAMCAREIRHVKFLPSDSFQFRIAIAAFFSLIEVMFVLSLAPVWIDPFWILGGFLLMSFCLHRLITHYYK